MGLMLLMEAVLVKLVSGSDYWKAHVSKRS